MPDQTPDQTPDAPLAPGPLTPGGYLRRCREARGWTLDDLALATETVPAVSARSRAEWLAMIEADVARISVRTGIALHQALGFDPDILDALIELDRVTERARRAEPLAAPIAAGADPVSDHLVEFVPRRTGRAAA